MKAESYKLFLNFEQILELVKQLSKRQKIELSRELEKEIIDKKLTELLQSFQTDDISQDLINKEVDKVRADLYAKSKGN